MSDSLDTIVDKFRTEPEPTEARFALISLRVPLKTKELYDEKQETTNQKLSKALAAVADKVIKDF